MEWGKNRMIVLAVILIALITIITSAPVKEMVYGSENEGKIAYVDLETIFNAHPARVEAESFLNQKAAELQKEMEKKAPDVERSELQDLLKEYQQQLTDVESDLLSEVLAEIDNSIKNVAEQKKVKLVIEKRNVLYGGYDMTDAVINYIEENDKNPEALDRKESVDNKETAEEQNNEF